MLRSLQRRLFSSRPSFGIAFDIDGVFVRGSHPIPSSINALHKVHALNIPYVFLTNGGGKLERVKTQSLQDILNSKHNSNPIQLDPDRMIQSHTPLLDLVPHFKDKTVLAIGNYNVCNVARDYGFKKVVNVADIVPSIPDLHPIKDSLYHTVPSHQRSIATASNGTSPPIGDIEAIFVMNDGLDWGAEMQVIIDIILQNSSKTHQIPLYFTNDDLLYSGKYHHPRLGGGTFRVALESVYAAITGKPLERTIIGKPYQMTYDYAEKRIAVLSENSVERFYGIGDNPKSDIRGANGRKNWTSVLLRTGIFPTSPNHLDNDPDDPADVVVENVIEAIEFICENEKLF